MIVRKKSQVKVFAGAAWEAKFAELARVFADRRKEFEFALHIHTVVGVDAANLKLNIVGVQTAELSRKYVAPSG